MPTHVSVIMPAYNAEQTISASIESVLAQTHGELELLVVNDCSADRTAEIVREFCERDKRVRLLENETNSGVSLSRNHGVREASFDWIAFLDSDDTWEPEKLKRQLETAASHPECSLFFTATAYVDENGVRSDYVLHAPEKVYRRELLCQNIVSCSSTLVKKECLLRHPMKDDRMIHEDLAAWLAVLDETPYAVGVDEPLLLYRVSKSGKSGNKFKAAKMQWRTYRAANVPFFTAAISFLRYAVRGVVKYASI
ncbi:MAG: glycosyltransferase family 2 protein [Clostridia bacterium]|nr:glycosyltransferase family 2 protein [Clostridia bacterium]